MIGKLFAFGRRRYRFGRQGREISHHPLFDMCPWKIFRFRNQDTPKRELTKQRRKAEVEEANW